jgi:hypothetical protein
VNLTKLKRYKEAIKAFEKAIEINPEEALGYSKLGELFFDLGNLVDASKNAEEALKRNENLASMLSLQGRIDIEEKNYDKASKSFKRAISLDIGNPKLLLWEAYANYLKAKFSLDSKDIGNPKLLPWEAYANYLKIKYSLDSKGEKYKEEVIVIIRNLERAVLLSKKDEEELKACILYFLGCFYLESEDAFTAKEKLEECIRLKSKSPIETSARELLGNIWNYKIRPPWWRWWLNSPFYHWPKRIGFFILVMFIMFIFALLLLHPFLPGWFPRIQINWTLYGFLIAILIIILISPSIEQIKVRDIEIELRSSPSLGPVLSPTEMEEKIKEIEEEEDTRIGGTK